jgi:hypothetical protein
VTLVTFGTRTVIDAVFGPTSCGELDYTRRLRRSLHAGILVLLDRNFDNYMALRLARAAHAEADVGRPRRSCAQATQISLFGRCLGGHPRSQFGVQIN